MRDHVRICGSPGRETDRGHPAGFMQLAGEDESDWLGS